MTPGLPVTANRVLPLSKAAERPDVSVIIVNYNTSHLLDRCFAALETGCGALQLQIIIVDNASRDSSAEILRTRFRFAEIIENSVNVGFGRANNQALSKVRGRFVLLLNTDAFVSPDTLPMTVSYMEAHPSCGVLGVKLVSEDGVLQQSSRYFPTPWNLFLLVTGLSRLFPGVRLVDDLSWDYSTVRECDWVTGCYYLIRREVIDQVGLFDPRFFMYYEEVDHCRAVREAGWNVMCYPYSSVVHIGGESVRSVGSVTRTGQNLALQVESELLYFRKHYGRRGLLTGVSLAMAGDVINAIKGMLKLDMARATAVAQHSWTVLRLLFKTGFATRPTR
jgi:GT2 family glycosyltransferase